MVRSSKKLYVSVKSILLSAIMAGFAAALLVIEAHAQDPYPKDVCSPGYVWRDAFFGDEVCVTPEHRAQADYDNRHGNERIDENSPSGALWGGEDCLPGYMWREAGPNDHVCVTQEAHDQAIADNHQAEDHMDKRYYYPTWANGAYRLDLCLNWGSGCGWAAAEEFCHRRRWTGARNFEAQPNIGASQPTQGVFFDSNQVCRESFCTGFKYITCYGKIFYDRVYANPRWKGHRLDVCLYGDSECGGKPAADAFCRQYEPWKGFKESFFYVVDPDPVPSNLDTITIRDGQVYGADEYTLYNFDMIICQ